MVLSQVGYGNQIGMVGMHKDTVVSSLPGLHPSCLLKDGNDDRCLHSGKMCNKTKVRKILPIYQGYGNKNITFLSTFVEKIEGRACL